MTCGTTTCRCKERTSWSLFFPVRPRGQERARFSRNGHSYTPAATRSATNDLRGLWQAYGSPVVGAEWFDVDITARFARPKSTRYPYPPRTDVDNIAKLVLDALQGHAFPNDSRVRELSVRKEWSSREGIHVVMKWGDGCPPGDRPPCACEGERDSTPSNKQSAE